ncbi:hypothetical protein SLA2020_083210 [Shorea laevis]
MGVSNFLSSLSCELRIIRAKNLEFVNSTGSFFVRYYLSAGKNKKVELNTQEISSKSGLFWNETFCLECLGTQEYLNDLKQQSVIFELRWRSTVPMLGKMRKSRLLGRGEVPWKAVFESENMEVEKWVPIVSAIDRTFEGVKPPSLEVAMKARAPAMEKVEQKKKKLRNWEGCGCKDSGKDECSFADYDMFALAAVLEGL